MFSTAGISAVTGIEGFSWAMACMAPITAAPPAISYFIFSMPSAGLIEMPPVSNVTPLPINARWSLRGGFVRRMVLDDDQRGRLGAALRDAEKRAHAELAACDPDRACRTAARTGWPSPGPRPQV